LLIHVFKQKSSGKVLRIASNCQCTVLQVSIVDCFAMMLLLRVRSGVICVCVFRLQRASTGLPSTRQTLEKPERPWYSAPVIAEGGGRAEESQSSDSCVSAVESAATADVTLSDTTTAVRRRLNDETMLDLTTPVTTRCHSPHDDHIATPGTPRAPVSRRTSETLVDAGSRPGSSRHAVLPPIRQLRSVDTVVTVGGAVGNAGDS